LNNILIQAIKSDYKSYLAQIKYGTKVYIIAMNYQPHALMTTGQPVNPTVQYQNAQQCGDTTYQQLD
jgi:signal transduction histidine kinase